MISYSTVEKVKTGSHVNISTWPNPAQDVLKIHDAGTGSGTSQASIYDQAGRMISQHVINTAGIHTIAINTLQPGIYIIRIQFANGETYNSQFLQQ
jgi:hypothetical protein